MVNCTIFCFHACAEAQIWTFFCGFISNCFLASFAFLFPSLSFLFVFYPLSPSIHCKSFGLSPSKNLEIKHWSTRWLGLFYHQLCTQNWTRFFWYSSARILVNIQNGHTCGWICPCCVSCLSKQSGDVKNNDVTSGSMSGVENDPKIRLLIVKR